MVLKLSMAGSDDAPQLFHFLVWVHVTFEVGHFTLQPNIDQCVSCWAIKESFCRMEDGQLVLLVLTLWEAWGRGFHSPVPWCFLLLTDIVCSASGMATYLFIFPVCFLTICIIKVWKVFFNVIKYKIAQASDKPLALLGLALWMASYLLKAENKLHSIMMTMLSFKRSSRSPALNSVMKSHPIELCFIVEQGRLEPTCGVVHSDRLEMDTDLFSRCFWR